MKAKTVAILGVLILITGCSSQNKSKGGVTKMFYGRTIEYRLDSEAKEYLTKLENLIVRAHEIDPPAPDKLIVPIYRDADVDRDHYISEDEAEYYYHEFVQEFEDSLGSVKYCADKD